MSEMRPQCPKRCRAVCHSRGFTLIELIVVIAIIGVLTAVLIPTMTGYIKRSRLNTANSNAKVVFNATQTVCQEMEFRERSLTDSQFYGSVKEGTIVLYAINGKLTKVYQTLSGTRAENAAIISSLDNTTSSSTFMQRIDRLFTGNNECCWAVYIENYTVRFVLAATSPETDYIGGYPTKQTERLEGENVPTIVDDPSEFKVKFVDPAWS